MNAIVFERNKVESSEGSCLLWDAHHATHNIRFEKNDILWQHNDKFIICNNNLRYHLIIIETRKNISFIPSGAKTQKIKRINHRKCNVRASKNAEQAFSTQWYLYSCDGLFFLFSSVLFLLFLNRLHNYNIFCRASYNYIVSKI